MPNSVNVLDCEWPVGLDPYVNRFGRLMPKEILCGTRLPKAVRAVPNLTQVCREPDGRIWWQKRFLCEEHQQRLHREGVEYIGCTEPDVGAWEFVHGDYRLGRQMLLGLPAAERPKLVVLDPPQNLDKEYEGTDDNRPRPDYYMFMQEAIEYAYEVMHPQGQLWVFSNTEDNKEMFDDILRDVFFTRRHPKAKEDRNRYRLINIYCRQSFAQCRTTFITNSARFITVWSPATKKQDITYGRGRQHTTREEQKDERWQDAAGIDNFWYWITVAKGHAQYSLDPELPNQVPWHIMEDVVLTATEPGDLVLELMAGAAPAGIKAVEHGRNYLGYELSEDYHSVGHARLTEDSPHRWSPPNGE